MHRREIEETQPMLPQMIAFQAAMTRKGEMAKPRSGNAQR